MTQQPRYTFGPVDFTALMGDSIGAAANALRALANPPERMRVRYVSLGLDETAMPWNEFAEVCRHTAMQTRGTVIGVLDRAMAELIIHPVPAIYRRFPARFAAARLEWSLRALYGLRNDGTALYGSSPSVRTLEAYERRRRGKIEYIPYSKRRRNGQVTQGDTRKSQKRGSDGQGAQEDARNPRKHGRKSNAGTGVRDRAHGKAGVRRKRFIEIWMGDKKLPDWGN